MPYLAGWASLECLIKRGWLEALDLLHFILALIQWPEPPFFFLSPSDAISSPAPFFLRREKERETFLTCPSSSPNVNLEAIDRD
jgi:hypothetical protein